MSAPLPAPAVEPAAVFEQPDFVETSCEGYFNLPFRVDVALLALHPGIVMSHAGRTVVSLDGVTIRHQVCKDKVLVRADSLAAAARANALMWPVYHQYRSTFETAEEARKRVIVDRAAAKKKYREEKAAKEAMDFPYGR